MQNNQKISRQKFEFWRLFWRSRRDSNYKQLCACYAMLVFTRSFHAKPNYILCKTTQCVQPLQQQRMGVREKIWVNYAPSTIVFMNPSILLALSRRISSVTCPYTSNVNDAVACPKFPCTVLMSSPARIAATA